MLPLRLVTKCVVFLFAASSTLWAASSALIVTGLSGSSEQKEEFQRLALETKRLIAERGIPSNRIEILGDGATRDAILERLKTASDSSSEDEFWLVLYGHGGNGRNGVSTFQVSGPRLTADDLKAALDAIPSRQFVFIGTSASGGFLKVLQDPRRATISATKEGGDVDWPRFPGAWVSALSENPKASFVRVAARASLLVEEEYKKASLAQIEHSRMADPVTGTILEPPFGVNLEAEKEIAPVAGGPQALPNASDIPKITFKKPNSEWEHHPATEETKKIVAEARALPNPGGHAAIVMDQRVGFTVEDDRTTDRLTYYRVFIVREEAVAKWANLLFPQAPPLLTTKLEIARLIQPDGSSTVYNPSKLAACTDPEGGCGSRVMAFLPDAKAGCVVEVGVRTRAVLNATLPEVSEEIPLLQNAPALKTSVEIRVPEKKSFRVDLKNLAAEPQVSSENGRRIYRWKLDALPAMEPLPGDPPLLKWMPYVGISSLSSWDQFAEWYRRLAKGADEIDDSVKKMASQLADGADSRLDKIKRDFEFVSALRYVAIETGVQGFRPRTPAQVLSNHYGDCKDKANLLVALLRAQGIEANFVLVNRGLDTDVNFPRWQFNHAIAYVPKAAAEGQPEDLWLDSTDSVTPFGCVAPGDSGRPGFVFGEKKAEFKTVTSGSTAVSQVSDEWDFAQDAQGWHGKFHRSTKGLADDFLRRDFRELTPAQRTTQLYSLVSGLWQAGDFSKATLSDASTLGKEMELWAEAAGPNGLLPRIASKDLDLFSAPERDRPVRLNDGQPMRLVQTVKLHYRGAAPAHLPTPIRTEAQGHKLSVAWERSDEHTIIRKAQLEFTQPQVETKDYAALRHSIREWLAALDREIK